MRRGILEEAAGDAPPAMPAQFRKDLESACASPPATLPAARLLLDRLTRSTEDLESTPESEADWWAQALARQCRAARDELIFLASWTELPEAPNGLGDLPVMDAIPTLRTLAGLDLALSSHLASELQAGTTPAQDARLADLRRHVARGSERAQTRIVAI